MRMAQGSFVDALRSRLRGDVMDDKLSRGIYATDASMYQVFPDVVVVPRDEEDVVSAITLAREYRVSVLPRGGATSLAGQTVNTGMVIDFSKYMDKVLEYRPEEKWIRVQPGINRDVLNALVKKDGLEFGPDPATSSRANIGGIVANNSSGTKSILYGMTIDHVIELKVLLADGTILTTKPLDRESLGSMLQRQDREGELYRGLKEIVDTHRGEIVDRYPKTMRRVGGYPLDRFLDEDDWMLGRIMIGSEGTLGIILEAKLRLVALPAHKCLAVVHFDNVLDAVRAVQTMVSYKPAAVEILSRLLLDFSRKNLETKPMCGFIKGEPESVQMVEFYGDSEKDMMDRAKRMCDQLVEMDLGYAYDIYREMDLMYRHVWDIRKKGLGLLLGEPGKKRAQALIEDAAIPLEVLPEYISRVMQVCDELGVAATYYAHASVGVIHVRPLLDMTDEEDIRKMKSISRSVYKLVKEYSGSWSSEHGDGIVRAGYQKDFYGERIYQAFLEVKKLFDPDHLLNPGRVIEAPPIDQNLRYGSGYHDQDVSTVYHYRDQIDFHTAVHQCSGIGACRKLGQGTMCPSFMVTRDEEHTTRGRANALRLAMSGQLGEDGLLDPRLKEALDLCLSCKACKAECPSSVDMARLKSEVLQMQYDARGVTMKERMVRESAQMARLFSGPFAGVVNAVQSSSLFRHTVQSALGFSSNRRLPSYAKQTLHSWYGKQYKPGRYGHTVVLFADTYCNHHESSTGIAAVKLLDRLGFDVLLADQGCCQRPRISNGFLKEAREEGGQTLMNMDGYFSEEYPVLTLEPSCATALTVDLPDLIDDVKLGEKAKSSVLPIESFLADYLDRFDQLKIELPKQILLHGHCHQKAIFGTGDVHKIFSHLGVTIQEPDSGCCGMAGAFGYEKEHYEISRKIGDRVLFKAIEDAGPEVPVVANGFSCRHQIRDFTGRKAVHWVELFRV